MDDNFFYSDMYGAQPKKAEPTPAPTPAKAAAAAHKQLGGLKITGSHVKRIDLGDQIVDLPTASYVKLLEDQIRALRGELREMQAHSRRLTNALNKQADQITAIKAELNKKLTVR